VCASTGRPSLQLRQLWEYRELLYFFVWRDVKVRYAQTFLGAAWAILQPVLTMVAFTIFLGRLAGVPSDGAPYPLFSYAALVPWTFFATGLGHGANSLSGSANLIDKVYFPRLLLPLAAVLGSALDFVLAFAVLLVLLLAYGAAPPVQIVALPLFLLLLVVATLGIVMWLAALNARYRDVRHAVPFLVQLLLLVTPVAYPTSIVPAAWRALYALNPMVGVVEGFRWSVLGTGQAPGLPLVVSTTTALVLLVSGAYYLRRTERTVADVL
jgi:lipopolysaccharide transport system permease protein